MASRWTRRFGLGVREHLSKNGGAVEQAAQGGGGVTFPGGVQETWRCGTEGLSGHGGDVSWLG